MKNRIGGILFIMGLIISDVVNAQVGNEIVSKRTWNSKSYLNPDNNTITVEISSGYVHYRDRDGSFQEIDRRIVLSPDSAHYQVTRGLYHAAFGFNLSDDEYPITFKIEDGTQLRARLARLAYYSRASKQLVTLQEVQKTKGIPNGNKIRYPEAFPGIDVEYEYIDTKLKQYAYLSQKARDYLPDPQTLGLNPNNTDLVLVTQIDLPDSLDAFVNDTPISTKPQGKIRLAFEGEDGVEFRNTGGKLKFLLPADFAFASAGGDSASEESSSRRMWRRFYSSGNDNFMATGVAVKWLYKQPEGTIVLDPTVSVSPPTDDVWIESDDPLINYNSYAQIRIGRGDGYGWKRSLVRFDVSAIPSNATIDSAKLQLYFYGKFGTTIINRSIQCHQVLQQWNQTQATWNNRLNSTPWGTPGVGLNGIDAKATSEDTKNWYNEYPTWKSYNLTALTQQWVNGSQANYGVIFWATDEDDYTNGDEKWVYSSEYSNATLRPKLVVTLKVNPLVEVSFYDALSRPATIIYANNVSENNQYDVNRGWLTRRDYQLFGQNLYYFNSTLGTDYDQAGNLKHQEFKHKTDAVANVDYAYNELHRITQFNHNGGGIPSQSQTYGYDPNGNLTAFTGKTMTYGLSNGKYCNQLTSDGSRTFTYDLAGRVQTIAGTTITHDIRNNMTAYGTNTYAYDAFNQRIRKTEGGTSKYYVTSGPQILAEYKSTNELEAEYIYALGRMIAKLDPSKGYLWFYVDHLNSTRLMDDQDSQTDLRRDYYPYGEAYLAVGDQTAYRFTQKELDSVTGLYYFGARYYDPSIGRWFVPDPAGQDWSPYAYARNRPVVMVDRDGRLFFMPFLIGAAIGGLWAGGSYSIMAGEHWTWKGFGSAVGLGALGGALSGGIGSLGASGWTNVAYGILGQGASWGATTAVSGGHLALAGLGGAIAGGVVGGLMPGYTAQRGGWLANSIAEIMYGAGKGAVTSSVAALASTGSLGSLNSAIRQGARYGAVNSFITVVMLGPAVQPHPKSISGLKKAEEHFSELGYGIGRFRPVYREGGLFGLIHRMGADGIALGRNLLVYDDDPETYIHETMHYYQQLMQGWGAFYGRAAHEQWFMKDPYSTKGTNEWSADDWARYYIKR